MNFRLVPKLVTLDGLERIIAPTLRYSPNSVAFGAHCVKWLKIHRYSLRQKCSPTNVVFSTISFISKYVR